jgi:hypothetical protein
VPAAVGICRGQEADTFHFRALVVRRRRRRNGEDLLGDLGRGVELGEVAGPGDGGGARRLFEALASSPR